MREGERLRLRAVEPSSERDLEAVTGLHMELLHFGPMAQLGEDFVREICYRVQLDDGLLRGALYEVDGRPAGFIVYTDRSVTFHRAALRRYWWKSAWVLALSLARNPSRLGRLLRALRVVFSRRQEKERLADPLGEVVCIAVRPGYLERQFVRETGSRVSEELVLHALKALREAGVKRVRMLVDEDNKAPLFLYHRLGATMRQYEVGGEPVTEVWFDLDRDPQHEQSLRVPRDAT